jgi:hypothetical protein
MSSENSVAQHFFHCFATRESDPHRDFRSGIYLIPKEMIIGQGVDSAVVKLDSVVTRYSTKGLGIEFALQQQMKRWSLHIW